MNTMNPFKVDYNNLDSVISFAKKMSDGYKHPIYVVKHPSRDNYNITMQLDKALSEGDVLIWSSTGMN